MPPDLSARPGRPAGRSLSGRASLNAVASGLDYGARVVVELIVTPLLVAGLGAQVFGAWRVLWQWSRYVWGASGRSAQALQSAIAHRQWTATTLEKRRLVGSAVVVWLCFSPLMLLVGALGVWLGPILLQVPAEHVVELRVAAALLVVDSLAVTLLTLPRSTLQGENLGYTRMGLTTGLIALGGVLLVLAVELGLGLVGVAGAVLLSSLLTGATFVHIARRRLPWFGLSRPSRGLVRWFLGLSTWFLGWKLVLELIVASDLLVLAGFASLTLVASYALTKFVAEALTQGLGLLVQASIPGIGGYIGSGRIAKAAALRGEVLALVWLVGTAAGATVVMWNGSFIGLWVGPDLFAGHSATLLMVALALQIALIKSDTFVIDVLLLPRVKVVAGTASAAVSIGLAVLAVGVLEAGIIGLCLGLAAGRAVLGVAAPLAVGRALGTPVAAQLRALARPLLVTVGVLTFAYLAAPRLGTSSWLELVPAVATTAALAAGVTALAGLSRIQRRRLLRRLLAAVAGSGRARA